MLLSKRVKGMHISVRNTSRHEGESTMLNLIISGHLAGWVILAAQGRGASHIKRSGMVVRKFKSKP